MALPGGTYKVCTTNTEREIRLRGFLVGGGVALIYDVYSDIMRLSCVGSGILYELLHRLETIEVVYGRAL